MSAKNFAAFQSPEDAKRYFAGDKVEKTMHEWKHGKLHMGSKSGPLVRSHKQAVAIALRQAGKAK